MYPHTPIPAHTHNAQPNSILEEWLHKGDEGSVEAKVV